MSWSHPNRSSRTSSRVSPASSVDVAGDGHHFEAVIVSAAFRGKNKVQQHQLVYRALGDRMREEIHALSMQTPRPRTGRKSSAALPPIWTS